MDLEMIDEMQKLLDQACACPDKAEGRSALGARTGGASVAHLRGGDPPSTGGSPSPRPFRTATGRHSRRSSDPTLGGCCPMLPSLLIDDPVGQVASPS